MTIDGWLKSVKEKIPRLDAELILVAVLQEILSRKVDRSFIAGYPDVGLSRDAWRRLDEMAERRVSRWRIFWGFGSFMGEILL